MEDLLFSLNATIPIFAVILIGWLCRRSGLISGEFASGADRLVFQLALPMMLFEEIADMDLHAVFDARFTAFCALAATGGFALSFIAARLFLKDRTKCGSFAQAASRGSAAALGIAFAMNIYGELGMTPMMVVAAVPLFNIYSVILLGFDGAGGHRAPLKSTLINIAKNPLIWGMLAGVIFSAAQIKLPSMADKTVDYLSSLATPLALLSAGANFDHRESLEKLAPTVGATLLKLLVIPGIFLPLAALLGFRNHEMVAILILTGSPTTVSCYIMAKNMGGDAALTAGTVMLATLCSSVTLTAWIFILRSMQLI